MNIKEESLLQQETPGMEGAGLYKTLEQCVKRGEHAATSRAVSQTRVPGHYGQTPLLTVH